MTANELRTKFLKFMESKGHTIIPSASLVPQNDPTVLFTTAGMHPLVPYLLGEKHPGGARVANAQKCVRTGDIDEVGDNRHLTFFEMLGNWSFGDYFKREAIEWSFEFLIGERWLGISPERIFVTVFKGDESVPRDEESIALWQEQFAKAGINAKVAGDDGTWSDPDVKIFPLGRDDNWWEGGGQTAPGGPDTEMFFDTRPQEGHLAKTFGELVDSFRFIEIWNDVFMQYRKKAIGGYEPLKQKNVDTGMGIERTLAVLNGVENVFETELFEPLFQKISEISGTNYANLQKEYRIIADHLKAATFILAAGVTPSNVEHGYVLRRLIRRAIRYAKLLGVTRVFTVDVAQAVIDMYKDVYFELEEKRAFIFEELAKEEEKFRQALARGKKELEKLIKQKQAERLKVISGEEAFSIYETSSLPIDLTKELAQEFGFEVDEKGFEEASQKHQELSRTASAGKFKGGLADHSEETTKLHTAAHLLLESLRRVLGDHILQKGSNITAERLRFDFSHHEKITPEQIKQVEEMVNEQIEKDLPVRVEEMTVAEAKKIGATGVFESKYGEKVKVYFIDNFSKEICGGPHVERAGMLGRFKIAKEESSSAGVRRIKAILTSRD